MPSPTGTVQRNAMDGEFDYKMLMPAEDCIHDGMFDICSMILIWPTN